MGPVVPQVAVPTFVAAEIAGGPVGIGVSRRSQFGSAARGREAGGVMCLHKYAAAALRHGWGRTRALQLQAFATSGEGKAS
uniref:Uncharacterized protein n=1 Tax=Oryza meridionalis TaxID=40149 RepID=A0A0E0FED5_9ORYZ